MIHERLRVCTILACVASWACSGAQEPEPRPAAPAARHLIDEETESADVPNSGLPKEIEAALGEEWVWIRGERLETLDWSLDRSASAAGGEIGVRATPRFEPVGPGRLVSWDGLDDPEAGRALGADEAIEPTLGEVRIDGEGIVSALEDPRELPALARVSYRARSAEVRAHCLGPAPSVADSSAAPSLTLGSQTRRVLPAAVPSRFSWRVEVPPGAQLRLGFGLRSNRLRLVEGGGLRLVDEGESSSDSGGRVGFWVSVLPEGEDERRVVWNEALSPAERDEFHEARVPLEDWAGRRVELSLATTEPRDRGEGILLPFWAEPVLDAPGPSAERPNVVLIVVDTLRADALGCYGNPRNVSPNIDDLARAGVRFADPLSAATWTLPSHTSIMTSLFPPQHGLLNRERLPETVETLAEVMRAAGYQTAAVTEGIFVTPRFGLDQGFDSFEVNAWRIERTAALALDHLSDVRGPTFLYWHTFQPHAPYDSVERFRDEFVRPYDGGLGLPVRNGDWTRLEELQGELTDEDMGYLRDLYDAEVAYTDEQVGRLLRGLRAKPGGEHTLVVVTSDHGEAFDEHGVWGHGTSTHREQSQVPLILWQPGRFEGGGVAEHPVHTLDIAPTIAAAVGLERPAAWEGELLSLTPGPSRRPLVCAYLSPRWQRRATALRSGPLKVMQNPPLEREAPFDPHADTVAHRVDEDPLEQHDLWEGLDRERWLGEIEAFWEEHPSLTGAERTRIDAVLEQELRDAGYVGD
ncbi:MAG: sulfatase [Planctomycetota bacterium]|jgi:arylsulfatase A-like enzyme|nr:sulfatase [Planctomycetota bacterium]MDP6761388.1 sulfatase [Planctomycetota bacterium]MDP6989405.1 sulfatase [Planctomycetota bacterium]